MHVCVQVNFLTKIIGLKPGPDLHMKLARVLGGEDEGADIVDEEKARLIARAQSVPRAQVGPLMSKLQILCLRYMRNLWSSRIILQIPHLSEQLPFQRV